MPQPYFSRNEVNDDLRRDELIHIIEHAIHQLTLAELEALHYDMLTKDYIR